MKHTLVPKGKAQALHLTPEYKEGQNSPPRCQNPYDFFDDYEKHYAFDIGNQKQLYFEENWLKRQINMAQKEIACWSKNKQEYMLRDDLDVTDEQNKIK